MFVIIGKDGWNGTGATTDVTHDARMGDTDNACTGAMTDMTHDVQTGCTYDA